MVVMVALLGWGLFLLMGALLGGVLVGEDAKEWE
jgi:hypothetical protein